jgi:hypothetical protein
MPFELKTSGAIPEVIIIKTKPFPNAADVAGIQAKVRSEHNPAYERTIRCKEPAIGISGSIAKPILCKKEAEATLLVEANKISVGRDAPE